MSASSTTMKCYNKRHKRPKTRSSGGRPPKSLNRPSHETPTVVIGDDEQLQEQPQKPKTGASVFWTKCDDCNVAYLYNRTMLGERIHCRHCLKSFIAVEATSLSPHIDKYIRLGSATSPHHGIVTGIDSASSPHQQRDKQDQNCSTHSMAFVKFESVNRERKKACNEREQENMNEKDTVVAGAESPSTSVPVTTNSLADSDFSGDNSLFRQGIWLLIRGFKDKLQSADVKQLDDLLLCGGMILRTISDLGLPDPGIGVLLENLKLQAAEIIKHCSDISCLKEVHVSCADKVNRSCLQLSDMQVSMASLGEQVVGLTESISRTRKSWFELIAKEEAIRKTRIKVDGDLACKEKQLLACQKSIAEATDAWKEMEERHSKTKELMAKAQKDLQSAIEMLTESEAKWKRLCEEAVKEEALLV
ncbi:uncharacterized protein LOC116260085 [Nymphaea colorata]|nr:uncharacterized protein LOC116260085 [Nymphaea colorata]XP_049935726.1 uncharacterized protein LOC116260085 [Nymphaea colorata]